IAAGVSQGGPHQRRVEPVQFDTDTGEAVLPTIADVVNDSINIGNVEPGGAADHCPRERRAGRAVRVVCKHDVVASASVDEIGAVEEFTRVAAGDLVLAVGEQRAAEYLVVAARTEDNVYACAADQDVIAGSV